MTSRELRTQRRAAERKANKKALKAGIILEGPSAAPTVESPGLNTSKEEFSPEFIAYANSVGDRIARKAGFDPKTGRRIAPETTPKEPIPSLLPTTRAEINRANAQHSTGPKTSQGKANASKNAVRHGLASNTFVVLEWENLDDFLDLLDNLRAEHQPFTQTEALLVEKMAEHFWLSQRALRLQDMCFRMDVPVCDQPKELALYIRYGTTHDRAFHKCLTDLQKLRAERRKEENGFVQQKRQQAAETRKQELHEAKLRNLQTPKTPRNLPAPNGWEPCGAASHAAADSQSASALARGKQPTFTSKAA